MITNFSSKKIEIATMTDIKVPTVGESINEVTLLKWNKKDGEYVERDEVIAELESEKATFEVNAEKAGIIHLGAFAEGDTIKIGDLLARIDETAGKPGKSQESGLPSISAAAEKEGVERPEPGIITEQRMLTPDTELITKN